MLKKLKVSIIYVMFFQLFLTGLAFATGELEGEQQRLQNERANINENLSVTEKEISRLIHEKEELNNQIKSLNGTINEFDDMIRDTEKKIGEKERQIDGLEKEINIIQDDLDKRTGLLKDRAITYQKTGSNNISYLEVILGSKSFSDFISRIVSLSKISQADEDFFKETSENQSVIFDLQGEFEEALNELEGQLEELDVIYKVVQTEKEEIENLIVETERMEKKQQEFIARLVNEDKELGKKEKEVRKQLEDKVRRQVEEEKRRQAAKSTQNTNVSRGNTSQTSKDGRWETFIATAYTANCTGCSGVTYTGVDLKANPNSKVIAVDPSVIPLGSRVEVKGHGVYLAADTGGAIQGRKIDIFMNSKGNAQSFGVRSVQIRVLN